MRNRAACVCVLQGDSLFWNSVAEERLFSDIQKLYSLSLPFFIAFSSNIQLCKPLLFFKMLLHHGYEFTEVLFTNLC